MGDLKRGLYDKFRIERTDGKSAPGQKHYSCRYFVLDLDHDRFALASLLAYALACEREYPLLAADLYRFLGSKDIPANPPPHAKKPHVLDTLEAFDDKVGLSVRLYNCLTHSWPRLYGGPFDASDAAGKTDAELLRMKNFGKHCLFELREALKVYWLIDQEKQA